MTRNNILLQLVISILLLSCEPTTNRSRKIVLRIKLICIPATYVDSIQTILLTDSFSDIGGGGEGSGIFGAGRVIAKNVKRNVDQNFYLHNVKKASYALLYMEGYVDGTLYGANSREVDFSNAKGDTANITSVL